MAIPYVRSPVLKYTTHPVDLFWCEFPKAEVIGVIHVIMKGVLAPAGGLRSRASVTRTPFLVGIADEVTGVVTVDRRTTA